jgi:hypothetical protein
MLWLREIKESHWINNLWMKAAFVRSDSCFFLVFVTKWQIKRINPSFRDPPYSICTPSGKRVNCIAEKSSFVTLRHTSIQLSLLFFTKESSHIWRSTEWYNTSTISLESAGMEQGKEKHLQLVHLKYVCLKYPFDFLVFLMTSPDTCFYFPTSFFKG